MVDFLVLLAIITVFLAALQVTGILKAAGCSRFWAVISGIFFYFFGIINLLLSPFVLIYSFFRSTIPRLFQLFFGGH